MDTVDPTAADVLRRAASGRLDHAWICDARYRVEKALTAMT
jgi:hypothetical protein